MGKGTVEVDFGVFPGASHAYFDITGLTDITTSMNVEAWIEPAATTDHSADEHMVETIRAFADKSSIVNGVGFRVNAFNTSQLNEPLTPFGRNVPAAQYPLAGGIGTRIYGKWKVGYVYA